MTRSLVITLAAAALLSVGSAEAVTLTNRDVEDHRLEIYEFYEEAGPRYLLVAAGKTLELCPEGCTIVPENGDEETFEGSEIVHVENGHLRIAE